MKINVHAGHNPDGKIGCGAMGIMGESTMNRDVAGCLIQYLREAGHTVYDCTVDDGANASDVLKKIVEKCNAHEVDWNISIHHNASSPDSGDGKVKGCEIYTCSMDKGKPAASTRILDEMEKEGFTSRGLKLRNDLYVLNKTKARALLIECCFCDDADDMNIWNPQVVAAAIMRGLTGDEPTDSVPNPPSTGNWYKIQLGAFKNIGNAKAALQDVKALGFTDAFIQVYD